MRIATWNLERPGLGNDARNQTVLEKIREVNADIWILTETHEVIDLSETHHAVTTTPSLRKPRLGESCAAIWSRWPIRSRIDTADSSEAVCVEVEHPSMPLLVYGSIIAWDGYKGPDGQSAKWEQHYRFIEWHGQDWRRLRQDYPDHLLVTAATTTRTGTEPAGMEHGKAEGCFRTHSRPPVWFA